MTRLESSEARDHVTHPTAASNSRDVAMHSDPRGTGGPEPDEIYGTVSVLYHSLKGATTYDKYIGDAQKAGDRELEEFFRACRSEAHARAHRALELLGRRIDESGMSDGGPAAPRAR